jgi:hypothetical protein
MGNWQLNHVYKQTEKLEAFQKDKMEIDIKKKGRIAPARSRSWLMTEFLTHYLIREAI